MIRPVRIRHARLLAEAHAALVRGGREAEVTKARNARVLEKARSIVARAREEDRLRRVAKFSALKALDQVRSAFGSMRASTSSEVDRERWRGRQELVERELREIVTRTSR